MQTTKWRYTNVTDLTEEQIKKTIASYDNGAKAYAEEWEWSNTAQNRTRKDYLFPFIENTKIDDAVLVVGSGTGRDINILHSRRYQCIGIDRSLGMLKEAIRRGVNCPLINDDILSFHAVSGSLDGILCESVLEHVRKSHFQDVLDRFFDWLRFSGILLLRVRLGEGNVFESLDRVGVRYFTSYTQREIDKIAKMNKVVRVLKTSVDPHIDPTRPPFYSILIKKL